ncbi:Dimethyl-sulfide monooxygenase [Fulvia fulva]|nr:Dimethyl-sulfide monooxygenase [Fulvia fulva]KAK4611324.1 Dimethyl-sulfide monooxygenase [Fulvia fulva]WPV22112.1 Dimethyl-sulfide monooxygenase [Fulvia fulva]WPV37356.1 Dimethyl-sulfide monooxygenase [Fulvia fulva]
MTIREHKRPFSSLHGLPSITSANGSTNGSNSRKKQLILNAFVESCSGHQSPGLWRHPDDKSANFNDIEHWVNLARLLESAKIHGIFIADVLGGHDVYRNSLDPAIISAAQWPVNEPLAVVAAMTAATKSIGVGVTVATTYEQPYDLAWRLSTIDHLSKGRLGWNIVTGYLDSAARNLINDEQPKHDNRYTVAEEYMKVMYKLFQSSWRDDAVVRDAKRGVFTAPERVRIIDHKGEFYTVPGPHICQPSPQRTPLLLQAGTSKSGKLFAAQHAEAIFVAGHSPSVVAASVAEIRKTAETKFRRDPNSLKFLAMFCPVIGKTQEEAVAKFEDYIQYGSVDGALALFGGWTGINLEPYADDEELRQVGSNAIQSAVEAWSKSSPGIAKWTKHTVARHLQIGGLGATVVGTPAHVADEMQRWVDEADVDGFNMPYAIFPGSFEDIVELLVPELRRRNVFWDEYAVPGGTYRENFYQREGQKQPLEQHVASKYRWRARVRREDAVIPE